MEHGEKIAFISGYLRAMEEINMDNRFQLYYRFQEVEKGANIEESVSLNYRNYVEKIKPFGEELNLLQSTLSDWFFNPVKPPEHQESAKDDARVLRFLTMLEHVLEDKPFMMYELETPPELFGVYSEHFIIEQDEHVYLLNFSWV